MTTDELLSRIAATLKTEVGPAVDGEYPKTQAFMASVVLNKIAGEVASKERHCRTNEVERAALITDLEPLIKSAKAPKPVAADFSRLKKDPSDLNLCALIEALYQSQSDLKQADFDAILARIRVTLRASIDRRLEYSA